MRDFEKVVAAETSHLERLWEEWHATNLELVCLAIEVLGKDGVELALNENDKITAAQMDAAAEKNKEHEARRADVEREAAGMKSFIHATAEETIKALVEQEKVR